MAAFLEGLRSQLKTRKTFVEEQAGAVSYGEGVGCKIDNTSRFAFENAKEKSHTGLIFIQLYDM